MTLPQTMKTLPILIATLLLAACVNYRAVRVNCDATLESINVPEPLTETEKVK